MADESGAEGGGDLLLAAIRREVESCEERLNAKISRLEQQFTKCVEAVEKMPQLDSRVTEVEMALPQLKRQFAELDGIVRGTSDELQGLVKRVASFDSRMLEAARKSEDGWRKRANELEALCKNAAASPNQQPAAAAAAADPADASSQSNIGAAPIQQVDNSTLLNEVAVLREAIEAAEAAVHTLAPRLLAAANESASEGKLLKAAEGLQVVCDDPDSIDRVEHVVASSQEEVENYKAFHLKHISSADLAPAAPRSPRSPKGESSWKSWWQKTF
eukprot:TRINITY_DN116285_c0_g1_i1.p1 TRINITY_DN116285_c0_g1~~TRINITY_DN116285_c0_g1_i1.p1  ORF type:complete len:274 (+),score=71.04 TRINITY_DN116285_c0_g1_i1:25-846(+)